MIQRNFCNFDFSSRHLLPCTSSKLFSRCSARRWALKALEDSRETLGMFFEDPGRLLEGPWWTWKAIEGPGKPFEDLEDSWKAWKVFGGEGRTFKDLEGTERLLDRFSKALGLLKGSLIPFRNLNPPEGPEDSEKAVQCPGRTLKSVEGNVLPLVFQDPQRPSTAFKVLPGHCMAFHESSGPSGAFKFLKGPYSTINIECPGKPLNPRNAFYGSFSKPL